MVSRAVFSLFVFLSLVTSAAAERRVALVVGNSAYVNAVKLPNPAGDAEAFAGVLKQNGFETVVLGMNVTRDGLLEKIGQFADAARTADTALFFYAGHAIQIDGKNYMIPVDADLKNELQAKNRTIDLDTVMTDAMGEAKRKLVLLDACRDNPFTKQIQASLPKTRSITMPSGLAEMRPGEGTLLVFATGPGQTALDGEGKHSPFTRALLTHLATPGLEIRHALTLVRTQVQEETRKQQLPWENTNMVGFFYFNPASAPTAGATVTPSVASVNAASGGFDPRMMELELWRAVQTSTQADDYKAYLEKYPAGTFSDLARTRVATLGAVPSSGAPTPATGEIKTTESSEASENALGLDRPKWRDLQKRLSGLGFSTRGIDGGIGPNTRKGVSAWQAARGYPTTGYFNRLQHEALLRENVPASAMKDDEEPEEKPVTRSARASGGGGGGGGRSSGGADAGAAGAFVGGVIRGVTGGKFGF